MSVSSNIVKTEERIQNACNRAGRKREEITLMAVSKFVPLEKIEEAVSVGIYCLGESRVREAVEKLEAFKEKHANVSLHMIGSLQRNKAKTAASFFDCIQSVDRMELIAELEKHTGQLEKDLDIFLELRTGEESKSGFEDLDGLFKAAESVLSLSRIKPAGLMTMAPCFEDMSKPDSIREVRSAFKRVANAQEELKKRFPLDNKNGSWDCLSMGMSNDFEIAIEEGATMLRIGSLIFKD